MTQVIVPFKLDSGVPIRIRAGSLPWARARMSVAVFNTGVIGGFAWFWYNRPDMTTAEVAKIIGGGGSTEATAGEFDADFIAGVGARDWINIPEGGNGAFTAYQQTGSNLYGMLIFEEQPHEHCPHCRVRLR